MELRAELQEERSERAIANMHVHAVEELRVASEEQFKAEQQQVHHLQEMHEKVQSKLTEERILTHTIRLSARAEMSETAACLEERSAEKLRAVRGEYEAEKQRSEQLQQVPEELSVSEKLVSNLRAELCEAEKRAYHDCQRVESILREQCAKQALAEAERATRREEALQSIRLCNRALDGDSFGERSAMNEPINAQAEPSIARSDEADQTEAGEEDGASSAASVKSISRHAGDPADEHESSESDSGSSSSSERSRSRSPRRLSPELRSASYAQSRRGPHNAVFTDGRLSLAAHDSRSSARGEGRRDNIFAGAASEDRVVICTPRPEAPSQPRVVHEDEEVIVLYKPPGWTCTTSSRSGARRIQDFLTSTVGERLPFIAEHSDAGMVHRLDRDTSGPLVVAKNRVSYDYLRRTVSTESGWYKEYITLVHGAMPVGQSYGEVNVPLEDDSDGEGLHKMRIASKRSYRKQDALSFYRVERLFQRRAWNGDLRRYSLMRFRIVSGRTHQIRLHARHIFKCLRERPRGVVCDDSYVLGNNGSKTFDPIQYREDREWCTRIFLHKTLLQLPRFGNMSRSLHVESPLPSDLEQACQHLESDERDEKLQQFDRFVRLSTARQRAPSPEHW
eukprot:TRINITY_DN17197_c0_g1_i2.p1 TRINITY_DN17197_c0_g1~~TRINITY_DN17197_c0_g1_i2.p1  ORF type:complete len:622 (+),score=81.68 TRINITY_DN17197_c0_g1_i2:181-2046(+)